MQQSLVYSATGAEWGTEGFEATAASLSFWRGLAACAVIAVTVWSLIDYVRAVWPAIRHMAKAKPT